ncbi:hypothetical protein [Thiorhodovibrio frisius]|uniref:Amidoligase enzyme n=1 Tax=Thiorhodovibrio frisius TaxID=631362 RepID=H8YZE4_9GAMM|nr:hypothetical protein [Thiorhodovibrio frisius]EIC22071.1 hypothetical protein Thi970DRAFT_02317 [Thiorhodovibrio frisius]WPL24363.1 hypothetical protein Thiofri_04582 [Thiorhodovibrio frisius]
MSEEIFFFRREDTLSHEQDRYYQDLFYRVLKIGPELECGLPGGMQPNVFRAHLEKRLRPSRDLENLGELGIFDVVKEHCGVEMQVIGRHPQWNSLMEQYRQIIDILLEEKMRMRQTCGLHFHLIAVGLSERIPQIILANLWNLVRKHAPGLKYLFSGGDVSSGMCRRRQHNAHQEFMEHAPVQKDMPEIQALLKQSQKVPEHQNFFNLEHVEFDEDGRIKTFHLEMRFPDGDLVPTSIVAKTFLFLALVLKAVELSKYGLIHTGRKGSWERKKQLLDLLSNNDGELARSDTSGIGDEEIRELRQDATDLLLFLKSIFNKFTNPAYSVLKHLAERPISAYRIEGRDWRDIERDLQGHVNYPVFVDDVDKVIIKHIELGLVRGQSSADDWLGCVSAKSGVTKTEVKQRINQYLERYPSWDGEEGSYVFGR